MTCKEIDMKLAFVQIFYSIALFGAHSVGGDHYPMAMGDWKDESLAPGH